jgi:hypothetical protein
MISTGVGRAAVNRPRQAIGDASAWVTGQVLYVEGGWLL